MFVKLNDKTEMKYFLSALQTGKIPLSPPGSAGRGQLSVSLPEVSLQPRGAGGGGFALGWLHPLRV